MPGRSRARDFAGILPPFGLVNVDRQKVAGVILEQRIDSHCVPPGQMFIDQSGGRRDQKAVATVAALDARLLADAGPPFIGAGRRITRFA